MKNQRLDNLLDRQKRHLVRDTIAMFVLVIGMGIAALAVTLHLPGMMAPQAVDEADVVSTDTDRTPAHVTAALLADQPYSVIQ